MQDRTINNALLALRKQGGTQGKLAEVLLDMRGVSPPSHYQNQPLGRNGTKQISWTLSETAHSPRLRLLGRFERQGPR